MNNVTNNSNRENYPTNFTECQYFPPFHEIKSSFLQELTTTITTPHETFESIQEALKNNMPNFHKFQFKYPIGNQEQGELFAKVLQIKAQEAHRFVPAIKLSEFISPCHLGFTRKIEIYDGPLIQEHVLVDKASNAVIFVEDWINNETVVGNFAAINQVIEQNGTWYFAGTYVYGDSQKDVSSKIQMFDVTHKNMMEFLKNEPVDEVHKQLKQY